MPFEGRKASKDRNHQLPMWRSRIGLCIGKRFELGSCLADLIEDVQKVTGTPGQSVKPSHQQNVAGLQTCQRLARAFLSVTSPLIFSANIRSAPAAFRLACCPSNS
jgi:hypothetical protein